jgi:hypothetical protein
MSTLVYQPNIEIPSPVTVEYFTDWLVIMPGVLQSLA